MVLSGACLSRFLFALLLGGQLSMALYGAFFLWGSDTIQRTTKGQQLKGTVGAALFHIFHTFPQMFTLFFQDFLLKSSLL